MLFLGFLKFLKRDKGEKLDLGPENMADLDIPPPPPDFGEKGLDELPELPELPDIKGEKLISKIEEKPLPKLPEEKPVSELELPPLPDLKPEDDIELELEGDIDIPTAPGFPELPELEPSMQKPRPIFPAQKPEEQKPKIGLPEFPKLKPEIRPYERLEKAAVREERDILRHKEAEGPIYIRVDRFRNILSGTSDIKNNLKTANESIIKMDEIDENRDKVFDKWHNVMMDLQKKLIFVDKTLFKR